MGSGASAQKAAKAAGPKFKEVYVEGATLGTGAFSEVKLCTHKVDDTKWAVKEIPKHKMSVEDYEALLMECELLNLMENEHIITLKETFEDKNTMYIVTELVEGGELFDRVVHKSKYTEKDARDLTKVFLETISYIHGKGVVHRDLKPENLLLVNETDDSNIKIADFGLAIKLSDMTGEEEACGTPGYIAPEIITGKKYGTEVDIWSIGVIVYVLLAGYPPFYNEDQRKLFKTIKEGKYYFHEQYWEGVSADAKDMITKMLTVNQKQRWTADQLLAHPWIKKGDTELEKIDLKGSIVTMRKFNAKRRLKAAADAIIMTNRIRKLVGGGFSQMKDNDKESMVFKRGQSALIADTAKASDAVEIEGHEVAAASKM